MAHPTREQRILLVSSSGGVLLDLLALAPWWQQHDRAWAVVRAADCESALTGERLHWIPDCSTEKVWGLAPGFVKAWRILRDERPSLIVSAGSGPAVPYFLLARPLGIPTFWLSTLNLVSTPGLTARVCSRVASRVLLQRGSMLASNPEGVVLGELY